MMMMMMKMVMVVVVLMSDVMVMVMVAAVVVVLLLMMAMMVMLMMMMMMMMNDQCKGCIFAATEQLCADPGRLLRRQQYHAGVQHLHHRDLLLSDDGPGQWLLQCLCPCQATRSVYLSSLSLSIFVQVQEGRELR